MAKRFINPSEGTTKYFSEAALNEADKDFVELFQSMFTRARSIAADESSPDADVRISRGAWQQGKWHTLQQRKRGGRYGTVISILRWANTLIPAVAGYALSERANEPWLLIFVVSVVAWAITFVIQEKLEADR